MQKFMVSTFFNQRTIVTRECSGWSYKELAYQEYIIHAMKVQKIVNYNKIRGMLKIYFFLTMKMYIELHANLLSKKK